MNDKLAGLENELNAKIEEVINANAAFAVENFGNRVYSNSKGRCNSIESHAQNVIDTLDEQGLPHSEKKVLAAYYARVAELLAK
ncbi:MAG TPA: hypothetical protein VHK27_05455 [Gammaproteobacteria bacterium]|nr:hypothetical protein [Gammaproteobacteria bacterium]